MMTNMNKKKNTLDPDITVDGAFIESPFAVPSKIIVFLLDICYIIIIVLKYKAHSVVIITAGM